MNASDGKTGDGREISYGNCKVIGNGSFGVVFQAKLVGDQEGEDIAIKKVLQDKRFKVSDLKNTYASLDILNRLVESGAANYAACVSPQCCRLAGILLFERRKGTCTVARGLGYGSFLTQIRKTKFI